MVSTNELIVFIHIAKTGGTTLRGILDKQYGTNSLFMYAHATFENLNSEDKLVNMLENHINNVKSISGHFGFGMKYDGIDTPLLSLVSTSRDIVYISILRNPTERLFSQYHHYKRNNWIDLDVTFEKFIKKNLYIPNYQTLCLSGTNTPNLDIAKRNIIKYFALVGITDMYKESLFLMKKRFNWRNFEYHKLNQFIKKPLINTIPNELRKIINNNNALDLKLYKFAKRLLKREIKSLSKSQKKELYYYTPFKER